MGAALIGHNRGMASEGKPAFRTAWATKQFGEIDGEIARLAIACDVDLFDRANIERVIRGDATLCPSNPAGFEKLRQMVMLHYAMRTRSAAVLGESETQAIIAAVVARIRERLAPP
jgi:hypothetical protein